jgi:2-dehydro-3-deoxyphosphogluconate aldolase / (4S)-4-hydroxy-2-oxoglutarate aldolase
MYTMNKKNEILQLIPQQGMLPLFFHHDPDVCTSVLKCLYHAGIRAVEFTNRGEAALSNFKNLREVCDNELPGMYLGIGTIKNLLDAKTFLDAGCDFIISPGLVEEVADLADEKELLWIPGCLSPTEIIRAENLGATLIKLFPGNILGPQFMTAIRPLFPNLLFMPTGGVNLEKENIQEWLKAGVCAVGMGSKLISNQLLEEKNYEKIEALTRETLELIASLRATSVKSN